MGCQFERREGLVEKPTDGAMMVNSVAPASLATLDP